MRRMATTHFKAAVMQLQCSAVPATRQQHSLFLPSLRAPLITALPLHLVKGSSHSPCTLANEHSTTRLYATRPGASERYMTPMQRVLQSRSQLRSSHPMELLRIAGVSFEGRQEAVAQLHPHQALAFKKEPENPYDPNAVAVHTLDGIPLGYVPKERTGAFLHQMCFGQVQSVGQADGGVMWGCSAEVQPRVPPVLVLPIPMNLTGKCHVAELLEGSSSEFEAVKAEILKTSGGKCHITGIFTTSVGEQWEVKEKERVLKLQGFTAQAPEVTRIAYMLESGENFKKELAVMNGWREEDVEQYVDYIQKQRSSSSEEWKLDLQVLEKIQELPEELKAYVV